MDDRVHVVDHPLVHDRMAKIRSIDTDSAQMRRYVDDVTRLLLTEALRALPISPIEVRTPLERTEGHVISTKVGLVPILRAGLGMITAAQQFLPEASVLHLGLKRDEDTLEPIAYYNKLPTPPMVSEAIILDPMLATGGTACEACVQLRASGIHRVQFVGLLASPEGLQTLLDAEPNITIVLAAIDRQLDERGFILPGLGDAGDRLFGT